MCVCVCLPPPPYLAEHAVKSWQPAHEKQMQHLDLFLQLTRSRLKFDRTQSLIRFTLLFGTLSLLFFLFGECS